MLKRISDNFAINDQVLTHIDPRRPIIQGVVCIKDDKGNILLTKKNIISYRARVWTLEKLTGINVCKNGTFEIPVTGYNKASATINRFDEYEDMTSHDNRTKVCSDLMKDKEKDFNIRLFSVGDAGCQRATDGTILPFNRIPPNTFDNDIYNPVMFKDKETWTDEKNIYWGSAYVRNSSNDGDWQFKKLNIVKVDKEPNEVEHCGYDWVFQDPEWHLSVANTIKTPYGKEVDMNSIDKDEEIKFSHEYAALRYDLKIFKDDLVYKENSLIKTTTSETYNVPVINELGLYICDQNYDPESIEMFSHVTFDSISFRDYKSLIIEYYLFV